MRYKFVIGLLMASVISLSGCDWIPKVRKLDVQQGNIITQEEINQLRPGMSVAQVKYLLGIPLLVSPYKDSPLYYVYTIQPGGEARETKRLILFFTEGQLSNLITTTPPEAEDTHAALPSPEELAPAPTPLNEEEIKAADRPTQKIPELVNPGTIAEDESNF